MHKYDTYILKLKHSFPQWVYGNISACLKNNQGVGATILICCAIDTLSYYASANPLKEGNKKRFIHFVKNYFPSISDPELFYKFVRSGLIHSFNMENYFIILCSNEKWTHSLHFQKAEGLKRTIINPFILLEQLKIAHSSFIKKLYSDDLILDGFIKAYKLRPLAKQNKSVKAFEKKYKNK